MTVPERLADATVASDVVQAPPETPSVKEMAFPTQTVPDVGAIAVGALLTVTEAVAAHVPIE